MMIEALKALVVVLIVNAGAFVFARMAFREFLSPAVIDRWRNILLLSTVAAFLIPNFWVMLVVIGVIAAMSSALETVRPSICFSFSPFPPRTSACRDFSASTTF